MPLRNAVVDGARARGRAVDVRPRTRADAQKALIGFGDSFAGRGADINETIRELRPFLVHLTR